MICLIQIKYSIKTNFNQIYLILQICLGCLTAYLIKLIIFHNYLICNLVDY
jgi:hypothetical protein